MTMTRPEWVTLAMDLLSDCNPEHVTYPYDHVVLIIRFKEDDGIKEEWLGVLDTEFDVMHLTLRSGSYVIQEVGEYSPEDVALWFDNKVAKLFDQELHFICDSTGYTNLLGH